MVSVLLQPTAAASAFFCSAILGTYISTRTERYNTYTSSCGWYSDGVAWCFASAPISTPLRLDSRLNTHRKHRECVLLLLLLRLRLHSRNGVCERGEETRWWPIFVGAHCISVSIRRYRTRNILSHICSMYV